MAMSKATLAAALTAAIQTKVEAATGNSMPAIALTVWTAVAEAIADEIIDEITKNAAVAVSVASVSLVTPGLGASGPGTGTGTIT